MSRQVRLGRPIFCGAVVTAQMLLFCGPAAAQQSMALPAGASIPGSSVAGMPLSGSLPGTSGFGRNGVSAGPASPAGSNAGTSTSAGAASSSDAQTAIPADLADLLARRLNPPAGTSLVNAATPQLGLRFNPRVEESVVQEAAAGRRLGGGYNSPSPEALTIDPRDSFESYVDSIGDPRRAR